jgi:hypothetical protein
MSIAELLAQSCHHVVDADSSVVVYDQSTSDADELRKSDSFLSILLDRLSDNFNATFLMNGRFAYFFFMSQNFRRVTKQNSIRIYADFCAQ